MGKVVKRLRVDIADILFLPKIISGKVVKTLPVNIMGIKPTQNHCG